ncbi:deleted in malignant brain tumors 1 protein-like isoform X2 [Pomacea canaliculata]|uniref:deleted in malignant brain tumors 1 protein-like isoform X2 n=1 Tax=Pomacea canaliculata TaxID=400727 RepID=UPI000D72FFB2|nr:deleted in malignant brain tumors 1 protein-like isoform X2 [Pomacea canaliculata]
MTMCPYMKSYFVFALLIPGFAGQMIPRLVNGTAWSGRLEVFDNGKWKTICKPCFDNSDLMVVCRDLGFSSERAVSVRSDLYGEGSGSILRTELSCTGYELRLSDCERGGVHHCEHWMDVGVICDSPGEMTPRLVNGAHWSGRLEVLEVGVWNTVCDREFGNNEAQVVCRMLGLNSPGAVSVTSDLFGEGSGSILSKRLKCTGTESKLSECQGSGTITDSCNHSMDVGVICNIPGQLTARLVGGNTSSGRLEVLNNGTWGAMCDEDFGLQETQVACRMLGFDSNVTSLTHDNSSGTVFYGNVTCNGTEASLTDCQHGGFSPRDCQQSRAVSISSPELTLRLVNGNPWSGRLEIFYHGKWRSMCDGSFGPKEAQVVCRMFAFDSPGAVRVYSVTYGRGSGTLRLANVRCAGSETSLLQCTHNGLRDEDCGHTDDIAVICNIREHFTPRLTAGNTWSGRLEILYSGTWSSVCDTSFGYKEARVGCRMLGFDSPDIFAVNSFVFGDRDSTVLFGDLDCQGTETSLVQCNYSSLYNHRCGAGRDIGLICKAQTGDFRLAGSHGNTLWRGSC